MCGIWVFSSPSFKDKSEKKGKKIFINIFCGINHQHTINHSDSVKKEYNRNRFKVNENFRFVEKCH